MKNLLLTKEEIYVQCVDSEEEQDFLESLIEENK